MEKLQGIETCLYTYRDQMNCATDALFLFVHWNLIRKGFQCVVDGKKTEILPTGWNAKNNSEYIINYSLNSKGYELKMLVVEDSLIINLMKKSNERTANVTCLTKNHVVNHRNEFQNLFIDIQDLCEKIDTEFDALINEDSENKNLESKCSEMKSTESLQTGQAMVRQAYVTPDNYGRSDLDPFYNDPLRIGGIGGGGMIFDPFRGQNYPQVPGNLPPGAVPPGARFDPFGPPLPDEFTGLGTRPMRGGPNPSNLRPPQFEDQFM